MEKTFRRNQYMFSYLFHLCIRETVHAFIEKEQKIPTLWEVVDLLQQRYPIHPIDIGEEEEELIANHLFYQQHRLQQKSILSGN